MKLLLDTQVLLCAVSDDARLPAAARTIIENLDNELNFSVASLWEVAVKSALGRPDFHVDVKLLRRALLDNGYVELAVTGRHAVVAAGLAALHKDPFDRMLIAQATADGMVLLTVDPLIGQYPGPIQML